MGQAGINDGRQLRPVHLWPRKTGTLKRVRLSFYKGVPFIGRNDKILTIGDLAPRTRVILHVNRHQKLAFSLPE